jgi:hypothetical protein
MDVRDSMSMGLYLGNCVEWFAICLNLDSEGWGSVEVNCPSTTISRMAFGIAMKRRGSRLHTT